MQTLRPDTYGCPRADAIRNQPMKAPLYILLIFFLPLILEGCSSASQKKTTEILDRVETELEKIDCDEEYCIQLLDSLPDTTLMTQNQRALRVLLQTQLRHKRHLHLSADSTIFPVVDFFEDTDAPLHLMKSYFLRSIFRYEKQDYRGALLDVLRSEKLAAGLADTLYMAKNQELAAFIYEKIYNAELALQSAATASDYYHRTGREKNSVFCARDMVTYTNYMGHYRRSIEILDSLVKITSPADTLLLSFLYKGYLLSYASRGDYNTAESYLLKMRELLGDNFGEYADFNEIAELYLLANKQDSVEKYIALGKEQLESPWTDIAYLANLEKFHSRNGDYFQAYAIADTLNRLTNQTFRDALNNQALLARYDLYKEIADREKQASRDKTLRLYMFIGICMAIAGMMVFLLKWKLQKQKALLAEALLSTSRLKDDLENIRKYQSRQQAAVNDVLSAGFCLIDPILKESYSLPANSPHTSKEFLNLLNIQIATMRSGEYIDRLKTSINNYRPDLIAEIEQTLPKLKKDNLYLILLHIAGLSTPSICFLLGISKETFYTRRRRLRAGIAKSDGPCSAELQKLLSGHEKNI